MGNGSARSTGRRNQEWTGSHWSSSATMTCSRQCRGCPRRRCPVGGRRAGATVVDAVAMGLGEGAGITALEEIAFALEVLYDVRTGLNVERVGEYCRLVRESFGIRFPPTKSIVGEGLYRHSIDSHQASILRGHWHSWECIHPRVVGQERHLEFGYAKVRRGGSGAIGALVEKLGRSATDVWVDA